MEAVVAKDFSVTMTGEEKVDNEDTYVLEVIRKDADKTQYGKKIMWIAKDKWVPVKQELPFYSLDQRRLL